MCPERQNRNAASWALVAAGIEQQPDNSYWTSWKNLARRFLDEGVQANLNRYFRAGQSMNHLVFSTLDYHRLRRESRVTIALRLPSEMRVTYGCGNIWFGTPELDYTLPFDQGFATFCRFLNHLWSDTTDEPIPEEVRGLAAVLSAPILNHGASMSEAKRRFGHTLPRGKVVGLPYKEVSLAARRKMLRVEPVSDESAEKPPKIPQLSACRAKNTR